MIYEHSANVGRGLLSSNGFKVCRILEIAIIRKTLYAVKLKGCQMRALMLPHYGDVVQQQEGGKNNFIFFIFTIFQNSTHLHFYFIFFIWTFVLFDFIYFDSS